MCEGGTAAWYLISRRGGESKSDVDWRTGRSTPSRAQCCTVTRKVRFAAFGGYRHAPSYSYRVSPFPQRLLHRPPQCISEAQVGIHIRIHNLHSTHIAHNSTSNFALLLRPGLVRSRISANQASHPAVSALPPQSAPQVSSLAKRKRRHTSLHRRQVTACDPVSQRQPPALVIDPFSSTSMGG